jgi:predicted O-linked N-acetylglucosamine transferase (SPINDLY family)
LKLIPQALASFDKALSLKADLDFLAGDRLFAAMQIFAPIDLDIELAGLTGRLAQGDKLLTPLICLAACDDPALHFTAAETWTNYFCPPNPQLGKAPVNANHQRIRIAYFSGDFREHPVALLTAQLFAYHDRNHFEVYAFSFSRHAKDEMRLRLEQVFEHFIDISDKTDMEAAQLARALQIDIAVDLNGHTIHARTGIFALRAAPIQVNYLGYPGTMAAPYMDYLIADQVIITAASRAAYAENMAFLPGSYLPNDTGRAIAESRPSRIACGLPENGFVFCCFNNAYKLTGRMFAVWMRILAAVPGSVLWVSTAAPARENMLAQAQEHGVNPSRLVFAERVDSQAEHLVRLQLADLFLDTLPYNAHATAVDALWAGLPVLTCPAKAFAGRVAASLLTAIEMPELIAENLERYEVLAVEIAVNPDRAAGLKQKLAVNRLTTALFDTRQYARDLENAFRHMHQRCLDGLTPTDFAVADLSEGLH